MHKTGNNAAIISLLNSAPAAMTNTPVMNATVLNTAINPQQNATLDAPIQTTSHQTILPKPILNPQQAAALQQQLQQQVSFAFLSVANIRMGIF